MKEFICKKDYYIEDVQFSKVGDHVILLQDNCTVVNTNGGQKCMNYPNIVKDLEYFSPTFEVSPKFPNNMNNLKDNKVDHPKWYTQHPSGIECIEITRHYCFAIGNAIKYLWRAGLKVEEGMTDKQKEIEDLEKAIWYIKDRVNQLKKDVEQ